MQAASRSASSGTAIVRDQSLPVPPAAAETMQSRGATPEASSPLMSSLNVPSPPTASILR